ncbi:MAG: hypothetical protein IBJ00_00680 [Alphaproteobacteria bacterium]|nr:hypothetical protein [Alphaproteobacteria bacterium]
MVNYTSSFSPLFGLEQEHFIFKDGVPPTKKDVEDFFILLNNYGYLVQVRNEEGKIGAIAKNTKYGLITIKNDFCTHILEVAFPPLQNLLNLEILYVETWNLISSQLRRLGIKIHYGGVLKELPNNTILYTPDQSAALRQSRLIQREVPSLKYSEVKFFAVICATQIHLNVHESQLYIYLDRLYSFEYLIPLLFSTSKIFLNHHAHCVRPLIYRDSFKSCYQAFAYPYIIPDSREKYNGMIKSSVSYLKDYSFIVPRRDLGTIEFRTACAQTDVKRIIELIVLRYAIFLIAQNFRSHSSTCSSFLFYKVCENGHINSSILQADFTQLKRALPFLPPTFRKPMMAVLERILNILKDINTEHER